MAASHGSYGDGGGSLRYSQGGRRYGEYGTRQIAEARLQAPETMPYLRPESCVYQGPSAPTSNRHREGGELHVSENRPRSLPPPARRRSRRYHERSPATTPRESGDPFQRAQGLLKGSFSRSPSGLGVAILGAVVGGLVAREASEASTRSKNYGHRRSDHETERVRTLSTVLGAAVGGLVANAIEKRTQAAKEKTAEKDEAYDKRKHHEPKSGRIERRGEDKSADDRGRQRSRERSRDIYPR